MDYLDDRLKDVNYICGLMVLFYFTVKIVGFFLRGNARNKCIKIEDVYVEFPVMVSKDEI